MLECLGEFEPSEIKSYIKCDHVLNCAKIFKTKRRNEISPKVQRVSNLVSAVQS